MDELDGLAARFEASRPRLHAVAYRMLGSAAEADDAVQEAWLHLSRSGGDGVQNLGGWLTTVVARVCLDMLRTRKSRREEFLDAQPGDAAGAAPALRDLKTPALAEQDVFGGNADVLQEHLGVAVRRIVIAEHRQHLLDLEA